MLDLAVPVVLSKHVALKIFVFFLYYVHSTKCIIREIIGNIWHFFPLEHFTILSEDIQNKDLYELDLEIRFRYRKRITKIFVVFLLLGKFFNYSGHGI